MAELQSFHHPTTISAALHLLDADPDSRVIAGGQTLVAMMNAGLVEPSALIGLRHVAGLREIAVQSDGAVRIGAISRHADIEEFSRFSGQNFLLADAARQIAHKAIRNAGTIGGSVAHGDPASDFPAALCALDGTIEVTGASGSRQIAARAFFVDFMQTALEPGEIVSAIRLAPAAAQSGGSYYKLSRVHGDYGIVTAAAAVEVDGDIIRRAGLALGGCGAVPVSSEEANGILVGLRTDSPKIAEAGRALAAVAEPLDDVRATSDYRRRVIPVAFERALRAAVAQARRNGAAR